jgi:hypothetical protein
LLSFLILNMLDPYYQQRADHILFTSTINLQV